MRYRHSVSRGRAVAVSDPQIGAPVAIITLRRLFPVLERLIVLSAYNLAFTLTGESHRAIYYCISATGRLQRADVAGGEILGSIKGISEQISFNRKDMGRELMELLSGYIRAS